MVHHTKVNQYITLTKEKKQHMIISIDAEKSFNKIQHPFMIKTLNKLLIEENFLNMRKAFLKNP